MSAAVARSLAPDTAGGEGGRCQALLPDGGTFDEVYQCLVDGGHSEDYARRWCAVLASNAPRLVAAGRRGPWRNQSQQPAMEMTHG